MINVDVSLFSFAHTDLTTEEDGVDSWVRTMTLLNICAMWEGKKKEKMFDRSLVMIEDGPDGIYLELLYFIRFRIR